MTGTERIRLENHIRDMAREINSNYPDAISDEIIEDLVSKSMSFECSYEEGIKIIDDSLSEFKIKDINIEEADKRFIDSMLENYNKHNNVSNPDKFFGDSLNFQIIELLNIYNEANEIDYSLEGKMLYFTRGRDELLRKYKDNHIKVIPYLFKVSFDDMKRLYDLFINNVDLVNDDYDTRMDHIFKKGYSVLVNGKINKESLDLERLEKVFDFAISKGKQIKLSNLLCSDIFPIELKNDLEGKSSDERRSYILNFFDEYVSYLAEWAKEKGYKFRQIDVIRNISDDSNNNVLYINSFWNDNLGKNPSNGDLYFIEFIKIVRKYFSDTELLFCEDYEYLPEKSSKIVSIMDYIKSVEERDNIKLIDAIGLESRYFDWNVDIRRALSVDDIYNSMLNIFNIGLPLYRTNYDFESNMSNDNVKKDLLHAIRITDQYCDISGVVLSSKKKSLLLDDFNPSEDYIYYADSFSNIKDDNVEEKKDEDELSKTVFLKLMSSEEAPSGYILSNSLLVFIILAFALLVIVASILLN